MESTRLELTGGVNRRTLFNVWRNKEDNSRKVDAVFKYLSEISDFNEYDEPSLTSICKTIRNFCGQLQSKWKKCHRLMERFLSINENWLEGSITFQSIHRHVFVTPVTPNLNKPILQGRPKKLFGECSQLTKRRKVKKMVQESSSAELAFATGLRLRAEGKRDAAKMVKFITSPTASPKRAKKMKINISAPENPPVKMSVERALALYTDNKFTKGQYIDIQQTSKEHNANIYPTYSQLLQAKKECYPCDTKFDEISGEVKLQSLLSHTIRRLVAVQLEVLKAQRDEYDPAHIDVIFKWGCDGASGQSRYKQGFQNSDNNDEYLFLVSLVPLRMTAASKINKSELILWQNPVPSSTKYCRPIKLIFHKETADFTREEVNNVKRQILELVPISVDIDAQHYTFFPKLSLTMIDGKICSTLSNKAGQNCHICGATPKMMNNLEAIQMRQVDDESISLGMSSLHAWIKFFECVLHIAYRKDIKCWKISKQNKESTDILKKDIQKKLWDEMKVLAYIPKQGFGNSNDGNTARRFFQNPELASSITGVNQELIERFAVILRTISSGFAINIEAFKCYAAETAQLYVRNDMYKWYYMPQSVHKILIHGWQIIKTAVLPIGLLSEEAQEARNKDLRRFREFHSRKFSREECVIDMFQMLLISSDPLISSLRRKTRKMSESFPDVVISLLEVPQPDIFNI